MQTERESPGAAPEACPSVCVCSRLADMIGAGMAGAQACKCRYFFAVGRLLKGLLAALPNSDLSSSTDELPRRTNTSGSPYTTITLALHPLPRLPPHGDPSVSPLASQSRYSLALRFEQQNVRNRVVSSNASWLPRLVPVC